VAKKNFFSGIETGRGIAALLVVFVHSSGILSYQLGNGVKPLNGFFGFGHAGVDFFFVLSGFIITYVHWKDIGKPDRLFYYLWRRFSRIYLVYWIALIVTIILYVVSPPVNKAYVLQPLYLLKSAFLIPTKGLGLTLGAAWTLVHEMFFYLLFISVIINLRFGIIVFITWIIIWWFNLSNVEGVTSLNYIIVPFHLEFFLGILIAVYFRLEKKISYHMLFIITGVILFFTAGICEVYFLKHSNSVFWRLAYGLPSSLIIMGVVQGELYSPFKIPKPFLLIGKSSYSIYLTHVPIIIVTTEILSRISFVTNIPLWISFFIICTITVIIGILFSMFIEQPLLDWSHSINTPSLDFMIQKLLKRGKQYEGNI
jgi:peptidoglycan/LPS O-acetylase OafA/YrhL